MMANALICVSYSWKILCTCYIMLLYICTKHFVARLFRSVETFTTGIRSNPLSVDAPKAKKKKRWSILVDSVGSQLPKPQTVDS